MRVENGIIFNENNIHVNIDTQTGEVTSFYIIWDKELEFPDIKGIISKDEAMEILVKGRGLDLEYQTENNDKGENSIRL